MPQRSCSAIAALLLASACSNGSEPKAAPSTAPVSPATATTVARGTAPGTTTSTTVARPATPTAADLAAVRIRLQTVVSGLSSPVAIAFRRSGASKNSPGTMYVAEKAGTLRAVVDGRASATAALDLGGNLSQGNEQGFLGATFSPDAAHLYVNYTDRNGDTNVDEFVMRGDRADPSTRRRVFFVEQPYSNHNGGQVSFGPDGMLYIGLGDGGAAGDPHGNGQNLATPLGKILRIDPNVVGGAAQSAPRSNPFVGRPGAFTQNWMWGLRNPWRFSFDRATGDVWIGDVGQGEYEEIDFAPRGQQGINWGWNLREGNHRFAGASPRGARDPIAETTHTDGNCAIIGGYVYRGSAIPALRGVYLFGDNCRPNIDGLVQRGGRAVAQRDMGIQVPDLTTFGEDGSGELYVAAREPGRIYRITSG